MTELVESMVEATQSKPVLRLGQQKCTYNWKAMDLKQYSPCFAEEGKDPSKTNHINDSCSHQSDVREQLASDPATTTKQRCGIPKVLLSIDSSSY
jgi:hypothetical protein